MSPSKTVALCVTCLVDQIYPDVGVATVRLLRRAGYEVDFPEDQTCCGQPFFNSGFWPEAAKLAKRTIKIFEDYEVVVLPSGSCTAMIRVEYPHLLAEWSDWKQRAEKLGAKTFELTEFLTHRAGWEPAATAPGPGVTYHDSCHMCRMLGLRQEPRNLLEQVGCQLTEMKEPDRCCGFGGLFSIRMPEVSNAMTIEKLDQASETGADVLVTSDPGCLMQMRMLMEGYSIRVEHIALLLEEATR